MICQVHMKGIILSAMCHVSRQSDITDFEEVVKPD